MAKRGGFPGGMPGNMNNIMKQAQTYAAPDGRDNKGTGREGSTQQQQAAVPLTVTVSGKKEVVSM